MVASCNHQKKVALRKGRKRLLKEEFILDNKRRKKILPFLKLVPSPLLLKPMQNEHVGMNLLTIPTPGKLNKSNHSYTNNH